jgi:multidrug efflux pump subunit AcrB
MAGVARQLFVPLALAVGFAMVSSYVLSSTLVPVMAAWLMRASTVSQENKGLFAHLRAAYGAYLRLVIRFRWPMAAAYAAGCALVLLLAGPRLGTEIFPRTDTGQFQLRLRAPTGTRIERTEVMALKALDVIRDQVGAGNVAITTDFVGVQPPSYPINTIYLWTSGPQEAVLQVALKPTARLRGEALQERLRAKLHQALPSASVSFEAGDIVSQVMSFGSPTPVEVAVQGPNLTANRAFAEKVRAELVRLPALRDLQFAQPMDYPTLEVVLDRERAGQFGLTASGVARSLVAATSSSRFIDPNYWRDPVSGNAFQIQVEIPQHRMASIDDVRDLPVMKGDAARPVLGDVATLKYGTAMGLVERYNMQRVVSLTANVHGEPLGTVASEIRTALRRAGAPPRGVTLAVRGQIPPLEETTNGLQTGLLLSIMVIFALLAAYFQSLRLAAAVIATAPATLCGVVLMLLVTGTTLNVQSFMGAIMAVGIGVANSILLVTFAQMHRAEGMAPRQAAIEGSQGRLRAVLMTALAMLAGMTPIALGLGEGGEQAAPLGRAVVGGLALATFATLTVLPSLYAIFERGAAARSPSLDPDDPRSRYYDAH